MLTRIVTYFVAFTFPMMGLMVGLVVASRMAQNDALVAYHSSTVNTERLNVYLSSRAPGHWEIVALAISGVVVGYRIFRLLESS